VVWWGQGDDDHRPIFLRFNSVDPHLAEDVERLDRQSPIVFSLRPRAAGESPLAVRTALAKPRRVMVTDADGMDALAGAEPESFEELITTSIVQAGHGLVDVTTANEARRIARRRVEAALLSNEVWTRETIDLARNFLTDSAALRIENYLQLLWTAGGASIESYPGSSEVVLDVGPQQLPGLLRLVLNSGTVDDMDYWRRLGSMLTLCDVEGLGHVAASQNFQRLIEANADRLLVSHSRTTHGATRLEADTTPLRWVIADSQLTLEGPEWDIEFTDDGRNFHDTPHGTPFRASKRRRRKRRALRSSRSTFKTRTTRSPFSDRTRTGLSAGAKSSGLLRVSPRPAW
jgi:hypothetical protein